jgi:hypothetical protein
VLVADEATMPKDVAGWAAVKATPVRTTSDNRNPLIDLSPGKAYALRVSINPDYSNFDAGVEAQIDGLDVFHFVDDSLRVGGKSKYPCYICPRAKAGGSMIIPGWHHTNDKSRAFVVRELGKGSDERMKAGEGTPGVITVRFAGAWDEGEDPPLDIKGRNAGKNMTDLGASVGTGFREVPKHIGKYNTTISIHYNH